MYIDFIFLVLFALYIWRDYTSGVFVLIARLIGFVIGIIFAFLFFKQLGGVFTRMMGVTSPVPYMVSFITIFLGIELLVGFIAKKLFSRVPESISDMLGLRILAGILAVVDSYIFISLLVIAITVVPQGAGIKEKITDSRTGQAVLNSLVSLNSFSEKFLHLDIQSSLSYFALKVEDGETVSIPYHPKTLTIDANAETEMLKLINEERAKAGVKPLELDQKLTDVARAHSQDMWQQSYFSHISPQGKDPFERLFDAGIVYHIAGENVAFSANVQVAHNGLMNSEGHRANILNPQFGKVGLGVISGGIYGEMFSQEFTN